MHFSNSSNSAALTIREWGAPGVFLFELTNVNGMSVTISNYGAAIVSCKVPDSLGTMEDVVLGYDTLEAYRNDQYYIGTVVGRYANRIRDAKVLIAGQAVQLTPASGGFHHHGGAQGFNKKIFHPEVFESAQQRGVQLTYMSPDGEEGYPGNLELRVTYNLSDDNSVTVEYEATTDKPTLLNLTQHTYFNLQGHRSGAIEEQYVKIMADKYLVVDENFIPTGEIKAVEGTVYDFRQGLRLGENIDAPEFYAGNGYDNSWVLETTHTPALKHAAQAADKISRRMLNVYTTEPSVHFYSGNFIGAGTPGKNGATYGKRSGFCLETQHFPDSPHHSHFPSTGLLPGEKFFSKTVFSFNSYSDTGEQAGTG